MYRAITLIELLTTLAIMVMAIYLISPTLFHLQDYIALNTEVENLKLFFFQLQNRASYINKGYSVSISQHPLQFKWCIIAIPSSKSNDYCNCLNLKNCRLNNNYLIYYNHYKSIIKNNSLTSEFTHLGQNSLGATTKCLKISVNHLEHILQLNELGIINVADKKKRSQCNGI